MKQRLVEWTDAKGGACFRAWPGQESVDNGIKMTFRLSVFDPGESWHHCVDRQCLAKLDELAARALIQAKVMAFGRFSRCCKTIADRYPLQREATAVQQSTAQSAMEQRRRQHAFHHVLRVT